MSPFFSFTFHLESCRFFIMISTLSLPRCRRRINLGTIVIALRNPPPPHCCTELFDALSDLQTYGTSTNGSFRTPGRKRPPKLQTGGGGGGCSRKEKHNSPRSISLLSHYFLSLSSVAQMAAFDGFSFSFLCVPSSVNLSLPIISCHDSFDT